DARNARARRARGSAARGDEAAARRHRGSPQRAGRDGLRVTPLKTRILLADDHAVVRRGLRLVLESEPDLEVVAEVGDGAEALARALDDDVDLAILDVTMPRMTGLHAASELHRRRPDLRVLILSMHDNEQYLFEALRAGASGYVLKSVADRDLVEACRATMRGEPFLYPGAVRALMRDFVDRARRGEDPPDDPLTPRETEIVKLIAEARTSRPRPRRRGRGSRRSPTSGPRWSWPTSTCPTTTASPSACGPAPSLRRPRSSSTPRSLTRDSRSAR